MKPPEDGARCPVHLLTAPLEGNGRFYGSDVQGQAGRQRRARANTFFELFLV